MKKAPDSIIFMPEDGDDTSYEYVRNDLGTDREKVLQLINQLDHRIECASKAYHNTRDWEQDTCEGDGFVGSYDEWIEQAFSELRAAV